MLDRLESWLVTRLGKGIVRAKDTQSFVANRIGLFSILAIAWGPGQGSPVHAHHTWCAVGVHAGELTESHYRLAPGNPHPVEVRCTTRGPGDTCFDGGREGIHRIVNRSDRLAISIHVYGVGADRIVTGVNRVFPAPA
jgi:predicted metal-dependent enzyme (double-stranded beta helix superfamily)